MMENPFLDRAVREADTSKSSKTSWFAPLPFSVWRKMMLGKKASPVDWLDFLIELPESLIFYRVFLTSDLFKAMVIHSKLWNSNSKIFQLWYFFKFSFGFPLPRGGFETFSLNILGYIFYLLTFFLTNFLSPRPSLS